MAIPESCWKLINSVNGYAFEIGNQLSTQALAGRCFRILKNQISEDFASDLTKRIKVRLLEDGYVCWFDRSDIIEKAISLEDPWTPNLLNIVQIESRIDLVLNWLENASKKNNHYLWGGTLGPNFDCSGLVQTSFASQEIWLPRDAYQQEKFCSPILVKASDYKNLRPGDLLFFGTPQVCNHVGIYIDNGSYWHSSGIQHGNNGIGSDQLSLTNQNSVSTYYRSALRGAGRVVSCHDGSSID